MSNKLFVTLDVLLEMRNHIQQGEPIHNCCHAVFESTAKLSRDVIQLTQQLQRYLETKLYDGYFSFEALTNRDWNQAVCGVCGIAPVFESGDGNAKNCTPLRKGQVYYYTVVKCAGTILLLKGRGI